MKRGVMQLIMATAIGTAATMSQAVDDENVLVVEVAGAISGTIEVELLPEHAPNHVSRIKYLASGGQYDNVVFHRVIDGFMAQTGDVKFGVLQRMPSAAYWMAVDLVNRRTAPLVAP